jgi:hypothetical protein
VEVFGEFWESEVARVGEEGSKGWRAFVEAGGQAEPPEPKTEAAGEVPEGITDPFKAWAAAEQRASEKGRMPARTLDDGADDDPYRVIMFSDIRDLLVWFPSAVLPQVKPLLAEAFLVFCGLPPAGIAGERFAVMLDDPFLGIKSQAFDIALTKADPETTPDLTRRTPEFRQQGGSMAISPDVLFSADSWFRYLDKWASVFRPGDTQVDLPWVLRTLAFLVKDCGMEALAEYYLAMEWRNEPAKARKVAKGLLKQYGANIRLYNAYALVESANKNMDVANKVLASASGLVPVSEVPRGKILRAMLTQPTVVHPQQEPVPMEHLGLDPPRVRPKGDSPRAALLVRRSRLPGAGRLPSPTPQGQVPVLEHTRLFSLLTGPRDNRPACRGPDAAGIPLHRRQHRSRLSRPRQHHGRTRHRRCLLLRARGPRAE